MDNGSIFSNKKRILFINNNFNHVNFDKFVKQSEIFLQNNKSGVSP
jgi:hypothetical protein